MRADWGSWREAGSGKTVEVIDPANGDVVGTIPDCGKEETDAAIEAAAEAFKIWRLRPAGERAEIIERWHAMIVANAKDLARIMTAEQGKPLAEAEGEIRYAATFVK